MAGIFKAIRGTVIRTESSTTPSFVTVGGLNTGAILMLTEAQVNRAQCVQYLKTLDTSNFGYAWGEGPGSIKAGGIIFFTSGCSIDGSGTGLVNGYYSSQNVYDGGAISISIGSATFIGYLEKLQITAEQNEYNYGTFNLEFTILPVG